MIRGVAAVVVFVIAVSTLRVRAIDLDVTPQDVDRALTIARLQDRERAAFHAPYLKQLNLATVERVEIVTEFRRIVLTTEDQLLKGDRAFAYSVTRAQQANAPWKGRMSRRLPAPAIPPAEQLRRRSSRRHRVAGSLGRRHRRSARPDPVVALGRPGESIARSSGRVVEAVFDAATLGQGVREFVIRLEGRELARVTFDLALSSDGCARGYAASRAARTRVLPVPAWILSVASAQLYLLSRCRHRQGERRQRHAGGHHRRTAARRSCRSSAARRSARRV